MMASLGIATSSSVGFLAVAGVLVLLAWSPWVRYFLPALLLGSLFVLASWLGPLDAVAMALFVFAPFPLIRIRWQKGDAAAHWPLVLGITLQIAMFAAIRRYAGIDLADLFGQPVAVIGLSYIMFRQIALLVEAPHVGELPLNATHYTAFLIAFWTLIAGPIQSYAGFVAGLSRVGRPDTGMTVEQMHRIVNGLIKSVLIAPLFLEPSRVGLLTNPDATWLDFAIVFYSYPIYLYLNFAGYVDIVIGFAKLCGFDTIPENFNRPYLARNTQDFWTRWHISLGIWIRHYVFTPLSKLLIVHCPDGLHGLALVATVLITFLIVGLWHGPTLNFIVFGLLQALGIIVVGIYGRVLKGALSKAQRARLSAHPATSALSIFLSFNFTCLSFLFLENSVADTVDAIGAVVFK